MLTCPARMEPFLGFSSVKANEALNHLVAFEAKRFTLAGLAFAT